MRSVTPIRGLPRNRHRSGADAPRRCDKRGHPRQSAAQRRRGHIARGLRLNPSRKLGFSCSVARLGQRSIWCPIRKLRTEANCCEASACGTVGTPAKRQTAEPPNSLRISNFTTSNIRGRSTQVLLARQREHREPNSSVPVTRCGGSSAKPTTFSASKVTRSALLPASWLRVTRVLSSGPLRTPAASPRRSRQRSMMRSSLPRH
jgi:hypothetical protein